MKKLSISCMAVTRVEVFVDWVERSTERKAKAIVLQSLRLKIFIYYWFAGEPLNYRTPYSVA